MKIYFICLFCIILSVSTIAQENNETPLIPQEGPINFNEGKPEENIASEPVDIPKPPAKKLNEPVTSDSELPPPPSKDKSKKINEYLGEALKNYEKILDERDTEEVKTTDKRIKSNKQLLQDHEKSLDESKQILRKFKSASLKRFMALKNAYNQGKIDKKTYDEEVKKLNNNYKFKRNALNKDISFYKEENTKTQKRLKGLQELNRINKIVLKQNEKEKKRPQAKKVPLSSLEQLSRGIKKIGCFKVQNFCSSSEIK